MGAKIDIDEVYAAKASIESKRAEAQAKLAQITIELNAEINDLEEELCQYETALRIMERHPSPTAKQSSEASGLDDIDEDGVLPRGELRRLIENTLNTFARNGAPVAAIREYIKARHHVDVQPNTVSVTLNRLKERGVAQLDGQKWSPAFTEPDPTPDIARYARKPSEPEADLDDEIPF